MFNCSRRRSYIVPISKPKEVDSKPLTCDDFRGIAISPVLTKTFEHRTILNRFASFFSTSPNQFGFKKGIGCSHAIRSVRNIVDSFIQGGSTVTLCAIDLYKAFDKVNHYALFSKLMKRFVPNELLIIIERWLSNCCSCVKWNDTWSDFFTFDFGVRQCSVLSPFLYTLYLDNISNLISSKTGVYIVLYADDILLMAPAVDVADQLLKSVVERELINLDMVINEKKSCCLRIGPRCNSCLSPSIYFIWSRNSMKGKNTVS